MLAVFAFTALVSYTDRLILSVLVDQIRSDLLLSDSYVGFLQGPAFTVVYVFAAVVCGRIADRRKRKPLLMGGVVLWCAAAVLCGLAHRPVELLLGRMLLGVGEAVLLPTTFSMIADAFPPERRGIANGTLIMSTVIGGPLGITVGGLLLAAAQAGSFVAWPLLGSLPPWRFVLVSTGIIGLVAPILMLSVIEPVRRQTGTGRVEGAISYLRANRRQLWPLYGAMALLSIGDYGLVSWVPTVLSRHYGWLPSRTGVVFGAVTALAGVAGSLLGGWISDRAAARSRSPGRLKVSVAAALFALLAAASICVGTANLVVAGLGLWVFASTVGAVSAFCVIQDLVPSQFLATGVAVLTFTNTLVGLGCGPALVGMASDALLLSQGAVDRSITLVAAPAAVMAALLLVIARRRVKGTQVQVSAYPID